MLLVHKFVFRFSFFEKRKTKNESRKTKNKPQNGDYKFHCKLDHEKAHSSD